MFVFYKLFFISTLLLFLGFILVQVNFKFKERKEKSKSLGREFHAAGDE